MNPRRSVDLNHGASSKRAGIEYALKRHGVRAEFQDRSALLRFVRESLPQDMGLDDTATLTDIAAIASLKQWTLFTFGPRDISNTELLQSAVNTIHKLLLTTELNMDDLEPDTLQEIQEAAKFQTLAAAMGFLQDCQVL